MKDSPTPIYLGVAVTLLAVYFQMQLINSREQLNKCEAKFQGFRDGVIYSK